jgi:hypothetical protein
MEMELLVLMFMFIISLSDEELVEDSRTHSDFM